MPRFSSIWSSGATKRAAISKPTPSCSMRSRTACRWSATARCCSSCTTWSGTSTRCAPRRPAASPTRTARSATTCTSTCTRRPGHEQWVMNDLEAVGVSPGATPSHRPSPHTLALNGYNYWAADRRHPCSVLGMMYALEVIASVYGGPFAAAIKESLLLEDERGVSFISSHATMDAEHMAELRQVLNTLARRRRRATRWSSRRCVNFHHFTRDLRGRMNRHDATGVSADAGPAVPLHPARVDRRARRCCACAPASSRSSATAWRRWPSCSRSSTTSRPTRAWCGTS